jgi:hypothetical protein
VTTLEKWVVWIGSVLVMLTGTIYLWMKYLLPAPDEFSVIHHPLQPLFLKLHILTAPILVLGIGSIALRHIWRQFMAGTRQGRLSGISSALVVVPMIVTGYLIQTITGEGLLRVLAWLHIGAGVIYGGAMLAHQVVALRGKRALGDVIAKGDRRRKRRKRM